MTWTLCLLGYRTSNNRISIATWKSFEYSVLLEALVKSSKRCLFFKATSKVLISVRIFWRTSKSLRNVRLCLLFASKTFEVYFLPLVILETNLQKDIISSKQTLCSQKFVVETIPLCLIWINHNETYIYTWALVCWITNTKLPLSLGTL